MGEQEQTIEQLRFDSQTVVIKTAEIIAGQEITDGLDGSAEYLAKSPGIGPRGETEFPQLENLTEAQITEIRAEAAKIGIGAEQSTGLQEAGLPIGSTVIAEGGLPNKMLAQLKMISENERNPGLIVMSASQTRVAGKGDATRMQQITATLGVETPDVTDKTEFELAEMTARLHSGFTPDEQPETLQFGYEIHDGGITPKEEATGQVVRIGSIGDSPVVVVGVSEMHRDDSGKNFYRPSVADLTGVASKIATDYSAEAEDLPVATVTSNLYGPSRRLQNPDTLTYGTKVMEEVVGEASAPATIQNIISEVDRTREVMLQQSS